VTKYNKLVRDRIPEIIKSKGEKVETHTAEDEEYWQQLLAKLQEELREFSQKPSLEELADVLEVVNAVIDFQGYDRAQLEQVRQKKRVERGGFERRIILEQAGD